MTPSDLRYQASREWMETEILAGRPIQNRRLSLPVNLDELDLEPRQRVEAILDGIVIDPDSGRVAVLDSGIDPELHFGPGDDDLVAMDEPVIQRVGELPELPRPTEDLEAVVSAWEDWEERYCDEALGAIRRLNDTRPSGKAIGRFPRDLIWSPIRIHFGPGLEKIVRPDDGASAIRHARAGWAWTRAARDRFGAESVMAAQEATIPTPAEGRVWLEVLDIGELAEKFLAQVKKMYLAAKAHDAARRAQVPDFDTEMARWASRHGSARLQLGIEDGYRMNARYLAERLAAEAPGFFAVPVNSIKADWARRTSSPSEPALQLRRRVQAAIEKSAPVNFHGPPLVEIATVTEPPPQIYVAHEELDQFGGVLVTDLPAKAGWPWHYDEDGDAFGYDAEPFEAVIVREWLGRFHLVGAVSHGDSTAPAGIWATPDLQHFQVDGSVDAQDPDAPAPKAAKRKPPRPGEDDEIPF